jgi:2-C-methyl-D-erythritol 2,4-cyclodiphosphate synthase
MSDFRIGFGVDVHQLVEGRDLIIGGVKLESDFGALGHSDADVLIHAICDAMLGACNLGDIGKHFPDTDDKFLNIDSRLLLSKTSELIYKQGYSLVNLDCTIVLEKPKVLPYLPKMCKEISSVLSVSDSLISIKATTHEKLDSFGQSIGIKAYCVCLLKKE